MATTYSGGAYDLGTLFEYNLVPPLQILLSGGAPVVYWQNDGQTHTLQSTTNLATGNWVNAPVLNWTNGSSLGLQITNHPPLPAAFFRLEQ